MLSSDPNNPVPLWLLAELTYSCPLQCPYCSNPLDIASSRKNELSTEQWKQVLADARALGAVQLGFSGGEPLVRQDLALLVKEANSLGFYTNLITSAVGLSKEKLVSFKAAGLNHIQISFQGSSAKSSQRFSGSDSFLHKVAMCREVKAQGFALGINFVLHRKNIHQVAEFLVLAESLNADFVELANCQYYAWALHNREHLLPSKEQLNQAEKALQQFRQHHKNDMEVIFVAPDYYDNRPKKCSNGWGSTFITVTPEGDVLPCQSARVIPDMKFPNIRQQPLEDIWKNAMLFTQFRGVSWMKEPCKSCPEKEDDLGGCRCQAFLLTGNAHNADPVCSLSPHHHQLQQIVKAAQEPQNDEGIEPLLFRNTQNAKQFQ